ncbi:hypothetical protein ACEWY4_006875 [Coilia grayii]|uniref:Uncharacterized protein n=1 Tax=Coilia grayii TaxID=363190 RepID=A0ABD1KFK6_9TELE
MVAGRVLWLLMLLSIQRGTWAFFTFTANSTNHLQMTEAAILQTTADACRSFAREMGTEFTLPQGPLTAESLVEACSSSESAIGFRVAIIEITKADVLVDVHGFNSDTFQRGRKLIINAIAAVKAVLKKHNFEAARAQLGAALNTLQDFYTHGCLGELGKMVPYSKFIGPDGPIKKIFGMSTFIVETLGAMCVCVCVCVCVNDTMLTAVFWCFTEKCGSHSEEHLDSHDGNLSTETAALAINVSVELLEDIRAAAGDEDFLRLMRMNQSTSALCFVIDTTGSMGDDIDIVRQTTSFIIDSKRGTPDEPYVYILVPFNDPDFGPLFETTDAEEFKREINELVAIGGGDFPEMSLSALELALTGAAYYSEIFVFTDASAKDIALKSTILALIEWSKSTVSMKSVPAISLGPPFGYPPATTDGQQQYDYPPLSRSLSNPVNQAYQELAQASGGLAVEVTKATLPQATSIIVDSSNSALVTLLQAVRDPGMSSRFDFFVDSSLRNLTIYITGQNLVFTVTSATGVSQKHNETTGALGTIKRVGNFFRVHVTKPLEKGLWFINILSIQPYTVKVIGQSPIAFLFNFVQILQHPQPGFEFIQSRPLTNSTASLLVYVTEAHSVRLTEVALVKESGETVVARNLEEKLRGIYLAAVAMVPEGSFAVQVKGINKRDSISSLEIFQRQSSTQFRSTRVNINTTAMLEPGVALAIPFTVSSNIGGSFTIRARNNRGFSMSFNTTLTLDAGGRAEGTVTLTAPPNTLSGTDVTLTIEAEAPGGTDSNYDVLRLIVLAEVSDLHPPTCLLTNVSTQCNGNCSLSTWRLFASLTDGNGTGIECIRVRQGSGTLNTRVVTGSDGVNVTLVTYEASCCSKEVELVAVDAVGNVGTCFRSIKAPSSVPFTNVTLVESPTSATAPTSTAPASTLQTKTSCHHIWRGKDSGEVSLRLSFWLNLIPFWLIKALLL